MKNYFFFETQLSTKVLNFSTVVALTFLKILFSLVLFIYMFHTSIEIYQKFPDLKEILKLSITNGLYIYVLIELIKSINDYFRYKRVKITSMIDITLVFLLRELVIGIFQHTYKMEYILAISLTILILIVGRVFTIKFSPSKV